MSQPTKKQFEHYVFEAEKWLTELKKFVREMPDDGTQEAATYASENPTPPLPPQPPK